MHPAAGEPAPFALNIVRAEGAWTFDALGKRYLDMQTPHAALNFGHRHPALILAAKKQLDLLHRTSFLLPATGMDALRTSLARLCGAEASHLLTSRYEALQHVGRAVRAGQRGRASASALPIVVATAMPELNARLSAAGQTKASAGVQASYGQDVLSEALGGPVLAVAWNDAAAMEAALVAGAAAAVVEPMVVQANVHTPSADYLRRVAAACEQAEVPLVVDESSTGLGRFGALLMSAQMGVQADMVVLGHALGGGIVPLTAVVGRRALLEPVEPHASRSPLAGNALACSIAQAALDLLEDGELVRRGAAMGERLRAGLLAANLPGIVEIAGRGLWLSVRLHAKLGPARVFCERLIGQGVLTMDAGGSYLQLAPALIIEPREVDWALERMVEVLSVPL